MGTLIGWKGGFPLGRVAQQLLLWCALVTVAFAERPTIQTFTTEQGLVSNGVVSAIQQDAQGFLWMATHEGLSRFDGMHFRNYGVEQGFPSPAQVYSILLTSNGDLWVGPSAARYVPNAPEAHRFRPVTVGPRKAMPIAFLEDHSHAVWALADGLYRNRDPAHTDAFERVCLNATADCTAPDDLGNVFLESSDRSLWIADGRHGLIHRMPSGQVQRFGQAEGLPDVVLSLLQDRQRHLWAGTAHGLVRLVDDPAPGRSVVAADVADRTGLPRCAVHALLQTRDGHLWAGTRCGLAELDGANLRLYTVADGLSQAVIQSVFEDRDGALWVGTESAGVMRMSRRGISAFGPEAGLEQEVIEGTLLSRDGRIVVLTNRGGKLVIKAGDRNGFRPLLPPLPLQPTDLGTQHWQVALEDHLGRWWIPGTNTLQVFGAASASRPGARSPLRVYSPRDGLPLGRIDSLAEDTHGDLWFGVYSPPHSTLWQWVRATGRFRSWEGEINVPRDRVPVALTATRSGSVWIAYGQGDLGRYRNGQHTVLHPPPGRGTTFLAIHEDDAGRLWAGRRNSLFYQVEDPEGEHPTLREIAGVKAPFLRCILNDSRGRLYLASETGLLQYDPSTGLIRHFHEREGLPSDVVQNGVRDRTGALWFGTGRGLMRFVPPEARSGVPPPVWIEGISIGGGALPGLSDRGETDVRHLRLAEGAGALKLDFNSRNFLSDTRFQYRLTPGDRDWSPPTPEHTVTYAGLRAGDYVFAVRAIDAEAHSELPATVSFAVLPPFWRRPWFFALCACGVCGLLTAAYRSRVSHLLQMERMRVRIASDLHDDIGANLSQIAVLSERLLREHRVRVPPAELLQQIADTAREITLSLGDAVWSISPERDHLPDLLSRMRRLGNDLCDAHDIAFTLHGEAPPLLAVNGHVRHQILLIFKESLRNAVRHSGCRHFTVACVPEGAGILLTFCDDGVGFDQHIHAEGVGLASMRRRAASVGACLDIHSFPGQGTTISVRTGKVDVPADRKAATPVGYSS